ncbi:MAG: selenide, water dikinase SelD [Saprospiraceae bacterium]|nr:selenide, water dikinase SelD [Saprospiraceae bacterium]
MGKVRLTQYSHGAGCGCKISPAVLDEILKTDVKNTFPGLLVGYDHKDDAAVLDLGNGSALISTTDFFMPIVDDAFDFGRIASVNAISDVYAMGGKPLMAIAILGWPIDKLSASEAASVIQGARSVCKEANIPLAGGHSIDSPEPVFGLAVSGMVETKHLKTNANARSGDLIYLTKPLGVGILTTAEKKGLLKEEHRNLAKESMLKLNVIGSLISNYSFVHSITDVTGFGLAGHLLEMAEASNLNSLLHYVKLPLIDKSVLNYIQDKCVPGGMLRNWKSYGHKVLMNSNMDHTIIADPQTSGGLLIAIDPNHQVEFENILRAYNCPVFCIGSFIDRESGANSNQRLIVQEFGG